VGEVSYVVFNGARVRPVGRNADDRARALADAQLRFVTAAEAIHAGAFPPRPAVEHLCNSCAYAAVCRMDYVAEPEDADTPAAV
jgi:PD-(D/E)XK nuclease superfamily